MAVRYKFKNTLSHYETIAFDGNSISLSDFKKTVVREKHLSKADDDLKVVNADTKQEFKSVDDLIPKNTSLIVSRVPLTPQTKKPVIDKRTLAAKDNVNDCVDTVRRVLEPFEEAVIDLSKLKISEEKKIELMMEQSTSAYNPKTYQKTENASADQGPKNSRCNRCNIAGHWVKDCPFAMMSKLKITENRRKAGIPRMFLQKESENENKENKLPKAVLFADKEADIPEDLLCPICKEIFIDAVMISCCGNSFCDDCVRNSILESTNNVCPACKETDTSPDSLIPNRFLRKLVQSFNGKSGLLVQRSDKLDANVDDQKKSL